MNSQVNANVVHESEAQRQHARVKIPAKLRFFNTDRTPTEADRKSTRLNPSHGYIAYAVFCFKKKKKK